MKIIGMDEHGHYIAVVSRTEVQKVCNKYYNDMPDLKIGQQLDLGAGYDFRSDIQSACKLMVSASKEFHSSQKTLFAFAQMVGKLPDADATQTGAAKASA